VRRILVVDDDPGIQETLEFVLEAEGFNVIPARDGEEALAALETNSPDLIVLDIMMPRMDGFTFAERYRERNHASAPILVMTADGRAQQKADQVGAQGYLSKPFDIDQLLESIETILAS
jgi:DNA-binding response OmpR family regulator